MNVKSDATSTADMAPTMSRLIAELLGTFLLVLGAMIAALIYRGVLGGRQEWS